MPIQGLKKESIDSILTSLLGLCHLIEPLYYPVVEPVIYNDRYLILIWVKGGYGRPYKVSKDVFNDKSNKEYYIRKFSSTVKATIGEEKELFYISSDIPFDDRENLLASVNDLDIGLMRSHLKQIGSNLYEQSCSISELDLAKDMQLISGPSKCLKPLNVGILMFCENPQQYFKYARIEVVNIIDPTGKNMEERIYDGPIQQQLKDCLAYLKNSIIVEKIIKTDDQAEAIRIFNYPFVAIEEILANAVYHRSYQINEPITIRITPKDIEIISYPGFDRSISDESIKKYDIKARMYRNRRIGDFLKELKLIEGRNTGFPNTFSALSKNDSPYPIFEMDEYRSYLSVKLPIHEAFLPKENGKDNLYEEKILIKLKDNDLNISEISLAMGYRSISKKLSKTIESLVYREKIIKVIVNGSIKYRIK